MRRGLGGLSLIFFRNPRRSALTVSSACYQFDLYDPSGGITMELTTKDDWQEAEARMNAWWAGEILDRPVIQVRAPRAGVDKREWSAIGSPGNLPPEQMDAWYTDVDHGHRTERALRRRHLLGWRSLSRDLSGGDQPGRHHLRPTWAVPTTLTTAAATGWAEPIIDDWCDA